MATHYYNFAADSIGAAPADFTHYSQTGNWTITVQDDDGVKGIRFSRTSTGADENWAVPTAIGSLSGSSLELEVVTHVKIQAGQTVAATLPTASIFVSTTDESGYVLQWEGATPRWTIVRLSAGGSVASTIANVNPPPFAFSDDQLVRVRLRRDSTGIFRGRIINGTTDADELSAINALLTAASLPTVSTIDEAKNTAAAWHMSSTAQVTITAGQLGIGARNQGTLPFYGPTGFATAGETAPTAGPFSVVSVTTMRHSESATVTGEGFTGAETLTIDGVSQTITGSTASTLTFTVDRGTLPYGAGKTVEVEQGAESDTTTGTLLPQTDWSFIDLVAPLADAGDRITAVADLEAGDQLAWDTQGGLVAVYANGSFDADASVTSFDVEAWDADDDTWGAEATQTVGDDAPVELVGAAIGSASASAALSQSIPLAGAAVATAAGNGALSLSISLSGAALAQALGAAQLSHGVPLAGGALAGGNAAATLSLSVALSGAAVAAATAEAELQGGVQLAGNAGAGASAAADLSLATHLSGAAVAGASASGGLLGSVSLEGGATAGAQAAATLTLAIGLTAQAVAHANAGGALTLAVNLTGDQVARAIAGAELTVLTDVFLEGAAVARAVGSGTLATESADVIASIEFGALRARSIEFKLY